MVGEKATSKTLRLTWQGNKARADGVQLSSRYRIALIGVGAAVNSAITPLTKLSTSHARTIAVDINPTRLQKLEADSKILIPKELLSGRLPPKEATAKETVKLLSEALNGVDLVFIVARLDSGIAAQVTPAIAEIAGRKGQIFARERSNETHR